MIVRCKSRCCAIKGERIFAEGVGVWGGAVILKLFGVL